MKMETQCKRKRWTRTLQIQITTNECFLLNRSIVINYRWTSQGELLWWITNLLWAKPSRNQFSIKSPFGLSQSLLLDHHHAILNRVCAQGLGISWNIIALRLYSFLLCALWRCALNFVMQQITGSLHCMRPAWHPDPEWPAKKCSKAPPGQEREYPVGPSIPGVAHSRPAKEVLSRNSMSVTQTTHSSVPERIATYATA